MRWDAIEETYSAVTEVTNRRILTTKPRRRLEGYGFLKNNIPLIGT
jgi:hypothetical protein